MPTERKANGKPQATKRSKYGICMICRKKKSLTEHHLKGHKELFSVMICRDCHDVLEWAKREGIISVED
jgi:hypothetical protein